MFSAARPAGFEPAAYGFEGPGTDAGNRPDAENMPDPSGEQARDAAPVGQDSGCAGPSGAGIDPVEAALADALAGATAAGEWSAVAKLAAELGARREARSALAERKPAKVVPLAKPVKRAR